MGNWQPEDVDDLAKAIREIETKLPGWWWSVGSCSVSRDASCGVDRTGPDGDLVREPLFGDAFSDDDPDGTTADALRQVMNEALHARDTRRATGEPLPPDFVPTASPQSGNPSLAKVALQSECSCGAIEGELHDFYCDMERCSQCAGQFLYCDCPEPFQDRPRAPFILFPLLCARCGVHWPEFFDVVDEVWQHYILRLGQGDKLLCLDCFDFIVAVTDEGEFASQHDGVVMLKDMKATSPVGSPGHIRWEQKMAKIRAMQAVEPPETEEPT